jgi:XRE family transcriptional regulator, regulator of sulfur utilization
MRCVALLLVRRWRKRRGLSLRALGKRAGVGYVTIFRLEKGRISPTVATLEKLAVALGIHVRDFFPPPKNGQRKTERSKQS